MLNSEGSDPVWGDNVSMNNEFIGQNFVLIKIRGLF